MRSQNASPNEQVLAGLAMLKVNWDARRGDLIDNFIPFVGEVFQQASTSVLTLDELLHGVRSLFGFAIPTKVMRTLLHRATRQKLAVKEASGYRRNEEAVSQFELTTAYRQVLREHEAVVTALIQHAKQAHNTQWLRDDAERALLSYLKEHAFAMLAAAVTGDPLPLQGNRPKGAGYIVATFVIAAEASRPDLFSSLESLAKGSFLASALALPDIGQASKSFEGVKIFLDTLFLLRALGYAGQTLEAEHREVLDLLYRENAQLRCFEHTVAEMQRVLRAAGDLLANPRRIYGLFEVVDFFRTAGWRASDVELEASRLERRLRGLRMSIEPVPPFKEELSLDEDLLETLLEREMYHGTREAVIHDLDSITAIHRLRVGKCPPRIERSAAIFITSSGGLVRASNTLFRGECAAGEAVPWCLLDDVFAAIVWLKRPVHAPDLPTKRLIASAYAALNPTPAVWRQYLKEVENLRQRGELTEDDYYLLRLSIEAKRSLMDITLGQRATVSALTVQDVLDQARSAARHDVVGQLDEERRRREAAEARTHRVEERARSLAVSGAKVISWTGFVAVTLVLGAATLLSWFRSVLRGSWAVVATVLLGILTVASVLALLFGGSVREWRRGLEVRLSRRLESLLLRLFGIRAG
jgi:hypothetical protein